MKREGVFFAFDKNSLKEMDPLELLWMNATIHFRIGKYMFRTSNSPSVLIEGFHELCCVSIQLLVAMDH